MRIVFRFVSIVTLCFLSSLLVREAALSQAETLHLDEVKHHWWHQDGWQAIAGNPPQVQPAQVNCEWYNAESDWWAVVSQALVNNVGDIIYRRYCNSSQNITNNPASDIDPAMNVDGSQVAFASNRDGNYEIYVMKSDGSNVRRLTTNSLNDSSLDWSKTDKIVFTSGSKDVNNDIWSMNSDGSNLRQLTNGGEDDIDPMWSVDGNKIYWIRIGAGSNDGDIWQMNADGSSPGKLAGPFRYLSHLSIANSGQKMIFDADLTGDGANDLILMNIDGSNLTTLQAGFFYDYGSSLQIGERWAGGWSPNDTVIYYSALEYTVTRQGVSLVQAAISYVCLVENCEGMGSDIAFNYNPDSVDLDPYPPVSQLLPLPLYSRKNDIVLNWQVANFGPAPLGKILIQQKSDTNPTWSDLVASEGLGGAMTTWSRLTTSVDNSKTVYFRMRTEDYAYNVEPFPPNNNAEVSTSLFAGWIEGKVTDNRNIDKYRFALSSQPAALDAIVTNEDGRYFARFDNLGIYVLNGNSTVLLNGDQTRNLYLPPTDSIIRDGGFEGHNLVNWQVENASISTSDSAAGEKTIRLSGVNCAISCLTLQSAVNIGVTSVGVTSVGVANVGATNEITLPVVSPPDMSVDALAATTDRVYALGRKGNVQTLYFSERIEFGAWSKPLPISNNPNLSGYTVVAGTGDTVYVLLIREDGLIRFIKRSGGTWSTPIDIIQGTLLSAVSSPLGGFHILYEKACAASQCKPGQTRYIAHRQVLASNVVSAEKILNDDAQFGNMDRSQVYSPRVAQVVDKGGILHLLQSEYVSNGGSIEGEVVPRIFYQTRTATGQWSSLRQIPNFYGSPLFAKINASGVLQFAFVNANLYFSSFNGNQWQEPTLIDSAGRSFYFANDATSDLAYVFGFDPYTDNFGSVLHRITSDGTLLDSDLTPIHNHFTDAQPFAVSGPNGLHVISHYWSENGETKSLLTSAVLTGALDSSISQSVTVSESLHKPTLSFLYLSDASALGRSFFEVSISHAVTTSLNPTATVNAAILLTDTLSQTITVTQLFSTTANTPWQLGWLDLTPWQGQTVTITFSVHQMAGDTPMEVYLDEVSLGSWLTPVTHDASPTKIEFGIGATLSITGENFLETPIVKLGSTFLSDVKLIDETRLTATIPATIPAGGYRVEVINPGGQNSMSPMIIYIGKQNFLPIIAR